MPLKRGTIARAAARTTFSGQPVSVTSSRVRRLRTALAKRDEKRFQALSWRWVRIPTTASTPSRSMTSSRSGRSSGKVCRSASRSPTTSPRACRKPASRAADWPLLAVKWRTLSLGSEVAIRSRASPEPSSEPSSTASSSQLLPRGSRASRTRATRGSRESSSLYTGTTTDSSIADSTTEAE